MATKFTDHIKKNPNAKDPQGQKGFNQPEWEKNQAATQKKVDDHVKAQQAPSTQSKFGAKMQKTAKAEQPAPNKNEPKR